MKKIRDKEKNSIKRKTKEKLRKLNEFVRNKERIEEINNFKTQFEICEIAYKYLLKQYKKLKCEKEVKSADLKINIAEARAALSFFGYKYEDVTIERLFGSGNGKGKRSAKFIRNVLTHDFNKSVAEELHNRKGEIFEYMNSFLRLINDENV